MKTFIAIILLASVGCTERKSALEKHTLDFGKFTMETPATWTKVEAQGIDSYVGAISIDPSDTLHFDLGWYSNNLDEGFPGQLPNRDSIVADSSRKNQVNWETIDGRRAKIVSPRQSGSGTTGVYIDSLWPSGINVDRFALYGINLLPENEKLLMEALKTLRFNNRKS